jgi:hypothetical protein
MHKKGLKSASVLALAKLKFTYIYHSIEIANVGPEHPPVQIIRSSGPQISHFYMKVDPGST